MQDLAPGDYTITVKNTDGCTSAETATINPVPDAPEVPVLAATQPDCINPLGSIEVTSPLGAEYTYSIDGTTFQAETTFAGLAPGDYTITVKNTDGCTSAETAQSIRCQMLRKCRCWLPHSLTASIRWEVLK